MLNKLLATVRRYEMLQPGDTVYCAVSGGADSVALLLALYLLKEKLGITLCAAHFNHGLRGEESHRDEDFVRGLCDRYEIPLAVGAGAVKAGEKGLEAAARDARYAFFATLPGKIATAHTADDNAETVLLRLVRGTGLKGLGAIAPVRANVIRPMLDVTRQEVLSFLEEYHLTYVEDSSNAGDAFLRNRLRHHVMPLLRQENPRLAENLSQMAQRLRLDEQALSVCVPEGTALSVDQTAALPEAVRSRVLARFLENVGVKEPEERHIRLAQALLLSEKPSARAAFPGGVTLERCYDTLRLASEEKSLTAVGLTCPGVTELDGFRVECRESDRIVNTEDTFSVMPEGSLLLRSRQSGDSIRLSGGTKTLKKLLIDKKIPASQRESLPVIADAQGILGVFGIGVNLDRAAVQTPCLQIKIIKRERHGEYDPRY